MKLLKEIWRGMEDTMNYNLSSIVRYENTKPMTAAQIKAHNEELVEQNERLDQEFKRGLPVLYGVVVTVVYLIVNYGGI